jgi:thiamine-phosphate pyrophosphorylase
MARCYSEAMPRRQPALPALWLVTDARNDARLAEALARLPRGSGMIYRHYHLAPAARRARYEQLARIARRRGHTVVLSGTVREARCWKAHGVYCAPAHAGASAGGVVPNWVAPGGLRPPPARGRALRLITAHSLREVAAARRARADALVLSPVFATRSHPGARTLGPLRFRLLAARAGAPVIALGGMDARRALWLGCAHWAAIDGLIPGDS